MPSMGSLQPRSDASPSQSDQQVQQGSPLPIEISQGRATDNSNHGGSTDVVSLPQDESTADPETTGISRATHLSRLLLSIAIMLSVFLVALDTTIISTAIPHITDTFTSLSDVGWYGGVYALTSSIFQLLFGRFYTIFNVKYTFLVSILIFEVGSTLCGAATTSDMFILGRALAGVGSAGIFSGAFIVVAKTVPLEWRAAYNGLFGALYGISSVIGPVLGGLLTVKLNWRWCFWINLPVGVLALVVVATYFKPELQSSDEARTDLENVGIKVRLTTLARLINVPSTLILLGATIPLLLALQWGGTEYHWQNGRIVALFTVATLSTILFVFVQARQKDEAFVPLRILQQRTVAACIFFNLTAGSSVVILIYYLPMWFQSALGVTALKSGFLNLPFVLSLVAGSIISGAMVTWVGYYMPFLVLSSILRSVGAGALTTLHPSSAKWEYILYQAVFGFGDGCGMQVPMIAVQTVLSEKDIPMGISVLIFAQTMGSAIFIAVGQSVFNDQVSNYVKERLKDTDSPVDSVAVVRAGATAFRQMGLSPAIVDKIALAYSDAITSTFYIAVALACLSIFGAAATEWRKVKADNKGKKTARQSSLVARQRSIELQSLSAIDFRADTNASYKSE